MPAPRKYDQETRDRAVRMYQDRRRDFPAESALQARRRVGELLDIKGPTRLSGERGFGAGVAWAGGAR
jgi:transposase